jgi:glycosyltransferase involved in cell wall biosynthesis
MRLAWFSPWPPVRSGVAGRSAELVPRLAARGYGIDVFVDHERVPTTRRDSADPPVAGAVRVQSAHDFVWRRARHSYDLAVYQLGNSEQHEFIWPYLFQWPGLVVLHDTRLHHARARALLLRRRHADYRAEFAWNHPGVDPAVAELAAMGFDGVYYYQWPMSRAVVESARLVAAHSRGAIAELEAASPGRPIEYIALGEGRPLTAGEEARARFRAALGWPASAVVFGVFGALTAEKRVPQILRAFATAQLRTPHARLVLAGAEDPQVRIAEIIQALGLTDVTCRLGSVDDAAFDEAIAAVDVSINLRWPTARETSGPWLRALAAGRATVIVDLEPQAHVPTLDPRTWRRHAPSVQTDTGAVAVGIDILDEDHSLRLALTRLAADAGLRARLGGAARAWWAAEHTVDRMTDDYERVIARAVAEPMPEVALPAHLRPDPFAHTRALVAPLGEPATSVVASLAAIAEGREGDEGSEEKMT